MLTLRLYVLTVAGLALAGYAWGQWQYHDGYSEGWAGGRKELLTEQFAQTEKQRTENAKWQQVEDTKAAEAQQQGEAKTITITKELIRYVQTPNRVKCDAPPERVQLRARAAANANLIPGFDGEAVPAGDASK